MAVRSGQPAESYVKTRPELINMHTGQRLDRGVDYNLSMTDGLQTDASVCQWEGAGGQSLTVTLQ